MFGLDRSRLAKHLVLIQSHIPLAFSQSALSSLLVREKAGADNASVITKITPVRLLILIGTMSRQRGRGYARSAWPHCANRPAPRALRRVMAKSSTTFSFVQNAARVLSAEVIGYSCLITCMSSNAFARRQAEAGFGCRRPVCFYLCRH